MQLNTEFACNAVIWISSLPAEDLGSMRRMVSDMVSLKDELGFHFQHFEVYSRAELTKLLSGLAFEAEHNNLRPLLHLDSHGNPDAGLYLAGEGSFVGWDELASLLRAINVNTVNNLAVVGAACFGLHAIRPISLTTATPFFLLLSPETKVNNGFLEMNLPRFYRTLFEAGSVEMAYAHLSAKFKYFHCEGMLFTAIAHYIVQQCTGKGRTERRERLLTEILSQGVAPTPDNLKQIRRLLKQGLLPDQSLIDRFAGRFLIGRQCSSQFDQLQHFVEGYSAP